MAVSAENRSIVCNGYVQMHGPGAGARDAAFNEGEAAVSFDVDIAAAYPAEAGLVRWPRSSILDRAARTIRLHDEYRFSRGDNRYEQRFMTACAPHAIDGRIVLSVAPGRPVLLEVTPQPDRVTLHAFALEDRHLRLVWGDTLYQIRLYFEHVAEEGQCDIVLSPRDEGLSDGVNSEVPLERGNLP